MAATSLKLPDELKQRIAAQSGVAFAMGRLNFYGLLNNGRTDFAVVAEGIETVEQLEFLRERHCDVAQGFYLARPLATPAVTELLHARTMAAREASDVRAAG